MQDIQNFIHSISTSNHENQELENLIQNIKKRTKIICQEENEEIYKNLKTHVHTDKYQYSNQAEISCHAVDLSFKSKQHFKQAAGHPQNWPATHAQNFIQPSPDLLSNIFHFEYERKGNIRPPILVYREDENNQKHSYCMLASLYESNETVTKYPPDKKMDKAVLYWESRRNQHHMEMHYRAQLKPLRLGWFAGVILKNFDNLLGYIWLIN